MPHPLTAHLFLFLSFSVSVSLCLSPSLLPPFQYSTHSSCPLIGGKLLFLKTSSSSSSSSTSQIRLGPLYLTDSCTRRIIISLVIMVRLILANLRNPLPSNQQPHHINFSMEVALFSLRR
ncbi:hypothetical protein ASPFODRAFT_40222 [Aspergillus luchuensis CBS 106.47]|uniref:Secreted protein n=1 Tax=Aspergillus luchuensis (strain CBS 106.47) TaxID=1137211 RepID=A0A1M3U165_ASPLC|nr:hypothetical protein ASPFODRAFT_40222 [Aspergillus luchuensis CBS 106.47]